jgi:hypothetical protein
VNSKSHKACQAERNEASQSLIFKPFGRKNLLPQGDKLDKENNPELLL